MDVRRRISFNMNTGGGQPSEPSTGGTYTVNLNNAWQLSTTITNPDSTLYDGVYQSYANKGVHNSGDIMYIDIEGLESFKLYIRSYAESSWDYIMVSQLDKTLTYNSSYSDTSLVKAHTRGNQNSGTSINNYTLVEFTGIDGGKHRISIIYRKDSSSNSGDDRGYVLIPKSNGSSGSGGSTPDNPGTGGDTSGPINTSNYMTILALENGLTASLSNNACQYCIDGDGNWIDLPAGTTTQSINQGQTLSFKGNLTPKSNSGIGTFTINKKCNLEGNCMSMLFGDDAVNNNSLSGKNYAFYNLFVGCTTIIQVSDTFLPATTLAKYCYSYMFYGCSSLTTAPELPATTLANYCYQYMFQGCKGLTTAPALLPATTLAESCYGSMFSYCTSLTQAPELPATTLVNYCYSNMFRGCTKLNYIKMLATDISASNCLNYWVGNVSSTGTFVKNPAMTSLPTGTNGIPSGWTVYNDGEEPGGNLITFTVDGTEYQAEEGMTWGVWCNSSYNTLNCFVSGSRVYYNKSGSVIDYLICANSIAVESTDLINAMSYTSVDSAAYD